MGKWIFWSAAFIASSSVLSGMSMAAGGWKWKPALGVMAALGIVSTAAACGLERAGIKPGWFAENAIVAFFLALGGALMFLGYPLAEEEKAQGKRKWRRVLFLAMASVTLMASLPRLIGMGSWGRWIWSVPAVSALPGVAGFWAFARARGHGFGEARIFVAGRVMVVGGMLLVLSATMVPQAAALESGLFHPLSVPSLKVLGCVAAYFVVLLALGACMGWRRDLAM